MILFIGPGGAAPRGARPSRSLDYRAVFGTMAKWVVDIDDLARLPELISRAFHVATQPPGPVVVVLPEDMLTEAVSVADARPYQVTWKPAPAPPRCKSWACTPAGAEQRRHPRRQLLIRPSRTRHRHICRALVTAGVLPVPPADALPRQPRQLRRRPGSGRQPLLLARMREISCWCRVPGCRKPLQATELFDIPNPAQPLGACTCRC